MGVENGTRMGKVTAAVLAAYRDGLPRSAIIEATGCQPSSLWNAVRVARRYVPSEEQVLFTEWRRNNRWLVRPTHQKSEKFRQANSEGHDGVRKEVLPLLLRGASTPEVTYITGSKPEKIYSVKQSLINERRLPPGRSPEDRWRNDRIRRFLKDGTSVGPFYDLDFVKKLYEAGFVTADLTNWQELHQLYEAYGRGLPASFADKLRLEFFLFAVEKALRGDKNPISQYKDLGRVVDKDWFDSSLGEEQGFISRILYAEWLTERSINNGDGHPKWRQPFLGGDDGQLVDTEALAIRRAKMREGQRPGKPWLAGDKALRERVLTDEQSGRGGGLRR